MAKKYELTDHPKSSAQLNAFFKQQGLSHRAVQGNGYIYWIDDLCRPSVYTCYISNMSFGQWLEEAHFLNRHED